MAFLGDIGSFFGLGSTGNVVSAVTGSPKIGSYAQKGADVISRIGDSRGADVAVTTTGATGAQESAGSGEITRDMMRSQAAREASLGFLSPALGVARTALSKPAVQVGLGLGGAALTAMGGGQAQQMRVTRKQQKQVKDMVMLIGIDATADMLGISNEQVVMILVKKFRARSQGITGAQLRNARRVNNKVIHMYNSLKAGYGSTTRRAPARKTTSITQVK